MDKIDINGREWIRLDDMCDILRLVGEDPVYKNAEKIVRRIASMMFYEDVQEAKTEEEKESARELPGEFVVVHDLGHKNPNGKRLIFFQKFEDGEGSAIDSGEKAMIFRYKSMAEKVAKKLKDEWKVYCVGEEYGKFQHRLWESIFGETENEE